MLREPRRQEVLREEDCHGYAEEATDEQRQQGAVKRAPDLRQNPVHAFVDIPGRGREKGEPVVADAWQCLAADLPQDRGQQKQQEPGAGNCHQPEGAVDEVVPAAGRAGDRVRSLGVLEASHGAGVAT